MVSRYDQSSIVGLAQAKSAFQKLPDVVRERMNDATEHSSIRILAGARQRLAPHRRYGFLENYLGYSMNRKTGEGRVGLPRRAAVIPGGAKIGAPKTRSIRRLGKKGNRWVQITTFDVYGEGSAKGAKTIYPSKYGHLVEFGHRKGAGKSSAPPSPFMIPSAEAEKTHYVRA